MEYDRNSVTLLLGRIREGDGNAHGMLFEMMYKDLRRMAGYYMKGERANHTLQPTALVHEAYVRLFGEATDAVNNRQEFLKLAGLAMRRVLVDLARVRKAEKRGGGGHQITLDDGLAVAVDNSDSILNMDQALEALAVRDQRAAKAVELKFFAGYTEVEIAEVLGVTDRTVKRDLKFAKGWLKERLEG